MNEFKYQFVNLLLLALLGAGIYWAFTTIDNGIVYDKDSVVVTNTKPLDKPIKEIVLFDNTKPEITEPAEEPIVEKPIVEENKNQTLITDLQKLVDLKVKMDRGANGEKVATVQKFLTVYFTDKNITIDKDFGPTTKNLVKEFQKRELNGGAGNIGPNTLKAMVNFLKK